MNDDSQSRPGTGRRRRRRRASRASKVKARADTHHNQPTATGEMPGHASASSQFGKCEYVPQTPLNSRQKLRKIVGKGPIKLYVLIMPMPPVALSAAFDHLSNCRVGGRWNSWRPKMRGYDVELERKPAENSHGRSRSIERS
jgi:hypothetical protein